ncbi:MAG: gliding motility lipoprotein GldK [Leeuwenhoekiella sp.]
MKKFIALFACIGLLSSCGGNDRGELVGVKGNTWNQEKPFGMAKVTGGAYVMGKSDDDIANKKDAPPKTVTVRSFYMDETEITNSEYRQFVQWVRDSVTRARLAILADELGEQPGNGGIGEYAFADSADPEDMTPYEQYMYDNYYSLSLDYGARKLNWDIDLEEDPQDYPDEYYVEVIDQLYIPMEESYNGNRTIDVDQLVYKYTYLDIEAAARQKDGSRKDFIKTEETEIYPDTTVWIKDFAYSYNEPMHNDYFWHSAYDEYPVVGVSWEQANAFCRWRTEWKNAYQKKRGKQQVNRFRLPIEAEWEYAARGGIEGGTYPWGGPYAKNDRGCFLANFKPLRGDYAADQALYTVEADAYEPNDFNLYNMSGNVAEWVGSSYDPSSYEYVSTMNPNANDSDNKRKVVRGGSWKDVAYSLQVSTRDYEYADTARSYIGFRTVQDYLGVDGEVNVNKPN